MSGGEGGIRTLGTGISQYNGLANESFSPPLTRFQGLTFGPVASKQDSVPLIRQLLCSTLCSIIKLLCLLRHLGDGGPNQRIEISCLFQHSHVVSKITSLYPLALFYGCTFLWILPWWAARMLFSKRPSIQESQTLTVDATGAHWSWDSGSYVLAWKNFIRWHEGKNGFVLYTSPATLNIVPKRLKGRVVICSYKDHVRLLFSRAFLVGLHRQVYSGLGSRHCHGISYAQNPSMSVIAWFRQLSKRERVFRRSPIIFAVI